MSDLTARSADRRDDRQVVCVPVWMLRETDGNARDAVALAQITYWFQPGRDGHPRTTRLAERDGHTWMYVTWSEMADEVAMSEDQLWRAAKSLRKRGLIDYRASQISHRKVTLIRVTMSRPEAAKPPDPKPRDRGRSTAGSRFPLPIEAREKPEHLEPAPNGARVDDVSNQEPLEPPPTSGSSKPETRRGNREKQPPNAVVLAADEITCSWWEERKAAGNPPAQSFIACRKVVEAVLRNGVAEARVAWALRQVPVVSSGSIEMAIQSRLRHPHGNAPRPSRQAEAVARMSARAAERIAEERGNVIDIHETKELGA